YAKLVKQFGKEIAGGKEINRKKLSNIVYKEKGKIKKLNKIVHKYVVKELIKRIEDNNKDIIFLDIPLMIEEKKKLETYGLEYDEIWLIKSKEDIRLKRIVNRDSISLEEAKKIIRNQMKDEDKEKYAHRIIENDGNIENLNKKIDSILTNIKIEKL
ncbi:MAG: dephospho-CoA kinase, partial [Bacillota bacterium]|nr:dephospho-CoA kinase [Bacillota bacterium]